MQFSPGPSLLLVLFVPALPAQTPPRDEASVRRFCGLHHQFPPPELFQREVWTKEVDRMFPLGGFPLEGDSFTPPRDVVLEWYRSHAPSRVEPARGQSQLGPGPLNFRLRSITPAGAPPTPAVSCVKLLPSLLPGKLDAVFADMRHGKIVLAELNLPGVPVHGLANVPHPGRVSPVDLDRDGIKDFLVADLGSFEPSDHDRGRVLWLRGRGGGAYEPIVLAEKLGRVADVQAADLDGDGLLDLAVAEFGWRATGSLFYLQNRTRDWSRPSFWPVTLDPRPGALETKIVDLDRDGRPDIVTAFAQQFESVEVFLNRGPGAPFERQVIWAAPHPAWGNSGIEVADLDGDGDLDVILSNGDTLDHSQLVPWQGVRWLENEGHFPFRERLFEQLPGCHAARAVDLDRDGDLDLVAAAFLPQFPMERARRPLGLESIIWLEQTSRGVFVRHNLETFECDHPTLDAGDLDGDGDVDLILGNFALSPEKLWPIGPWLLVVENLLMDDSAARSKK